MDRFVSSPRIARRAFLGGLLTTAALPVWAAGSAGEADVAIIGAGAAGLAAARTLMAEGRSVAVFEARNRIGGRAWTDGATFGMPFDRGCSWLQQADRNPFKPLADDWGYTTLFHDDADEAVYVGDRRANRTESAQYDRAWRALNRAVSLAGRQGRDVSAASVAPSDLPWIEVAEAWFGPMDMAMDLVDFSCADWWSMDDPEPNYMIKEGFGTLVAQYGRGLPVRLETPVERVRWGGPGVALDTPRGTLRAKACIVTVSTGVLGSGRIVFDPPLPLWKQEAIAHVPMGLLAKIALRFRDTRFGIAPNAWLTYYTRAREACFFLCWPFDFDLMIGWVGGSFGWELTGAGEAAAIDFARGELRRMFGSEVDRNFVDGTFTRWGDDPWTLGSYASAMPGHARERAMLAKRVADRLFFAGEACAGGLAQTCGGAYLSGQRTARDVAVALDRRG